MKTKTRILLLLLVQACWMQAGAQQLYNMGFDTWSRQGVSWNPFPKDAPESQRVWDSANRGIRLFRINVAEPEYGHVAVPGPGKCAAKLSSRNILWGFVTGNLYVGRFVRVVNFAGIEMYNGAPFRGRPKSLSGYYHYIPGTIDYADKAHQDLKGKADSGQIDITLYGWSAPLHTVTTDGPTPDPEKDPALIGRAVLRLDKATDGYVHFDIPIHYYSDDIPTYVGINIFSSLLGECFTGSSQTVLYVDEFEFQY